VIDWLRPQTHAHFDYIAAGCVWGFSAGLLAGIALEVLRVRLLSRGR